MSVTNVGLHADELSFISLCTGGGGLDLGIELAIPSSRAICLVEREAFAISHLVSAMEEGVMAPAPVWSDVGTFDGRPWRGLVDGIIGGIPCQPHSIAGLRLGEDDERDLWSDARRIIVRARPWFVLIENVRGMVSSGGLERVWRDLRRLGYQVEPGLFTASEIGAPHDRERVFVLAVADDAFRGRQAAVGSCDEGQDVAYTGDAGLEGVEFGGASRELNGIATSGSIAELCGACLVDAEAIGQGEGRFEPVLDRRGDSVAGTGGELADADDAGAEARRQPGLGAGQESRRAFPQQTGDAVDDAANRPGQLHPRQGARWCGEADPRGASGILPIFPPRPNELGEWRAALDRAAQLEPSIRRVAHGVAPWMDNAGWPFKRRAGGVPDDGSWTAFTIRHRIDRLRMLGNGVVPLQAAYAIRTLASRLAGRGSAGAAWLVRLMAA